MASISSKLSLSTFSETYNQFIKVFLIKFLYYMVHAIGYHSALHTFYCIQKIWDRYTACCETTRSRATDVMQPVSYRTFCRYWLKQLPHIVIGKPRSDLCWTCQQNSTAIMKLANTSDRQKQKVH